MLTQRQQTILNILVHEYIKVAEPVSSQLLAEQYDFGIHRAMIRREMRELASQGYLSQPHTSAGKVPTDKGYRFVVDAIMREKTNQSYAAEMWEAIQQEYRATKTLKTLHFLTRSVAEASSAFALGYLKSEQMAWREGWEEILQEPELKDPDCVNRFIKILDKIEDGLAEMKTPATIQVYIGEENPFVKADDFSTLIVGFRPAGEQKGVLAIIGPKRMPYERNIKLMASLSCFINSLQ